MIYESLNYKERGFNGVKILDILRFKIELFFVMLQFFRDYEKDRKYRGFIVGRYESYKRDRIRKESVECYCIVWG